jgi:3-methyladenine DNA glycosylase AlkD
MYVDNEERTVALETWTQYTQSDEAQKQKTDQSAALTCWATGTTEKGCTQCSVAFPIRLQNSTAHATINPSSPPSDVPPAATLLGPEPPFP